MWRAALVIWAALSGHAISQPIISAPYSQLKQELDGIASFESVPGRAEPGLSFDQPLRFPGIWIAEHFAGQQIDRGLHGHDRLESADPIAPLAIRSGRPKQNQSVAAHRGFGSNALFPLGPDGFDLISGRGEGAVAILFDHDQAAIGLRVHSDYAAPLGSAKEPGQLIVHFFRRDGRIIFTDTQSLAPAITDLGWRGKHGLAEIAGILVLNTDPGGIAMDDILFQRVPPLG